MFVDEGVFFAVLMEEVGDRWKTGGR